MSKLEIGRDQSLKKLVFYEKGAMSFQDREIPKETVNGILTAATSSAWLGRWKLVAVNNKENIIRVVESWRDGLRRIGQYKGADFIARWKKTPPLIVFCQPIRHDQYQFVPGDLVRIFIIQEVGTAVRSIELVALSYGIGLHGIMGVLVREVGEQIKVVLSIPESQEIVYFGVMGYPSEEVVQKFPTLSDVCYAEAWGRTSGFC